MYKLTNFNSITRLSDNASIPLDPRNRDYVEYLAWIALGNTPTPAEGVDIAQLKIKKDTEINDSRFKANNTSFQHKGKVILCDALSRGDIDAVANHISLFGIFPPGFPGAWKAADGSYTIMPDVDSFKDMYKSMTLQGTMNFKHAQNLKTALASAATQTEVDAIVW